MRTLVPLVTVGMLVLLTACGTPTPPPPAAPVTITAPLQNAEMITGSAVQVEGTVVEGTDVDVSIGGSVSVAATLLAPAAGRRGWHVELTAPAPGNHTITATAPDAVGGSAEATVAVKVLPVAPFGMWQGEFFIDRRPTGGELEDGGTLVVWYTQNWFRMYFGGSTIEVFGTTDGWDLIDKDGFTMVGSYHAAGEKNEHGTVMNAPWVDYLGVLESGVIITGSAELDD